MSFLKDSLPVYGPDREILYYAPLSTVPRLIDSGRARPVGTAKRVRGLVAICAAVEMLRESRPPAGTRFSDNHETPDNPRGVWHFKRRSYGYA